MEAATSVSPVRRPPRSRSGRQATPRRASRSYRSPITSSISHIARVAGVDHVGIGSDFDGVDNVLPEGLGGVDTYRALLAQLMRRRWSDADIAKLAGGNALRAMDAAERIAASMAGTPIAAVTRETIDGRHFVSAPLDATARPALKRAQSVSTPRAAAVDRRLTEPTI